MNPERLQSGVRKWLTYIALLLTAAAMICDLNWLFDYFLMGELTSRTESDKSSPPLPPALTA